MSLQLLAKQMEAKGRKGDSMLVHMTPGEVEGLQKLAEAAGGTLTINPETGLVEANFLKDLIRSPFFAPLAGAGLMMIPGVGPMMAAGLVGGGTALATGDAKKGLMAGFGAYGGAGLAGGLGASAAGTAAGNAANIAAPGAGAVATGAGSQASMLAAQNAGFGAEGLGLMAQAAKVPASTAALNTAKAGISGLGSEAGRAAFMQGVGGVGGLAKKASMAAAPAMMAPGKAPGPTPTDDEMYAYDFDYGRTGADSMPASSSAERMYFNPTFSNRRKVKAADYFNAAEGGEVADAASTDAGIAGGMTGASKAAFDYLMGNVASSAPQGIAAPAVRSAPVVGADNMYAFDPATGAFLRNPNIPGATTSGSRVGTSFGGSDGDKNPEMSQQTKDFFDRETPAQRDARMAGVNKVLSYVIPGAFTAKTVKDLFGFTPQAPAPVDNRGGMNPSRGGYDPSRGDVGGPGGRGVTGTATGGMGPSSARAQGGEIYAEGGLMGLAKGGMKSGGFVVPADVVSMIGEGNTDAGYSRIKSMIPGATAIKGKDGGQADTVKTSIEGKQPARVAHGEMYIPPETVKRMGGAKKLYAMMDRVREQATGSKKQIKPVSLKQAMA